MRRPAILFLAALGLAGVAGANAAVRPHDGGKAAAPARVVLTGDVVVQRSATSADVVVAVDGGTRGQAADGIAQWLLDRGLSGAVRLGDQRPPLPAGPR